MLIAAQLAWPLEVVDFALFGFGFYMLHACIQVYVTELAPAARGSAVALHSFFFFLGQAVGPIVYGVGFDHRPSTPVLLSAPSCWSPIGLICAHWLRRPAPV